MVVYIYMFSIHIHKCNTYIFYKICMLYIGKHVMICLSACIFLATVDDLIWK